MITTSYEEERRALHLGIEWLGTTQYSKAAFCTDSLSFLKSMDALKPETAPTRQLIEQLESQVSLMYVPGHKDIPGNEIADKHAKEAAKIEGPYAKADVSLMAARSAIKREVRDKPSTHRIISKLYANHDEKVEPESRRGKHVHS